MNTFYTSSNQSVLLITVCVEALIGDCVSACGWYTVAAAPIRATRLRLMWWNPHRAMMCSAEGWQSLGEALAMSEACWTTYMFRTAAPVCQHADSTNPLCSHYLPEFFHSFLLCGELRCRRCLPLCSFYVSYHTFDLCLLRAGAWKFYYYGLSGPVVWVLEGEGRSVSVSELWFKLVHLLRCTASLEVVSDTGGLYLAESYILDLKWKIKVITFAPTRKYKIAIKLVLTQTSQ